METFSVRVYFRLQPFLYKGVVQLFCKIVSLDSTFIALWVPNYFILESALYLTKLVQIIDKVTDCYKKDPNIVPEELHTWFDKFARQQKVLRNILKVRLSNYQSSLLIGCKLKFVPRNYRTL